MAVKLVFKTMNVKIVLKAIKQMEHNVFPNAI